MSERLPVPSSVKIGKDISKSPEANGGIKTFTSEAKAALEGLKYKIITLPGKSILDYRKEGANFLTDWHKHKAFENRTSINSEIAILPDGLLAKSDNKPLSEQRKMVEEYKEFLKTKDINGVEVIIGKSPENVAIVNIIKSESNGKVNPLAGKAVRCDEESPISNEYHSFGVNVRVDPEDGILIVDRDNRGAKKDVFVLPIIVPASATVK